MSGTIESLFAEASGGDYEAASALLALAKKERNLLAQFQAHLLLGNDEAEDVFLSQFNKGNDDICTELASWLGFVFSRETCDALEQLCKSANGRRRASIMGIGDVLRVIIRACRSEHRWAYLGSYATQAGTTTCLAVWGKGHLSVGVAKGSSLEIEPDDYADGYREEWEVYYYPPFPDAGFGKAFFGWATMALEAQTETASRWANRKPAKNTLRFAMCKEQKSIFAIAAPSAIADLVSVEQNQRYLAAAKLADVSKPALHDWAHLANALLTWPKGVMDDIELTMLERLIASWPAQLKDIAPCIQAHYWDNTRPVMRLARSLHLNDMMRAFIRGEAPCQAQLDFSQITHLVLPENDWGLEIFRKWEKPVQLERLHTVALGCFNDPESWAAIEPWPYWQQVTEIHWNFGGNELAISLEGKNAPHPDKWFSQLTELHISDTNIKQPLAALICRFQTVQSLTLEKIKLDQKASKAMAASLPPSCESLRLINTTWKQLPTLEQVGADNALQELHLEGYRAKSASAWFEEMAEASWLQSLTSLTLAENKVTKAAMMALCQSPWLSQLKELRIDNSGISEIDAEQLWNHWTSRGLQLLIVDGMAWKAD